MFTIGIFTTHLPYIALVVFYAFFWVFGVNKASTGELNSGKSLLSVEISAYEKVAEISHTASFDNVAASDNFFIPPDNLYYSTAIQKIIHRGYYLFEYFPDNIYNVLFSRPPPFPL